MKRGDRQGGWRGAWLAWLFIPLWVCGGGTLRAVDTVQLTKGRIAVGDYEGALALIEPYAASCASCREASYLEALCLVRLHRNLARAETLLGFQEESPQVGLLWAELYHKTYRFRPAIAAYHRYAERADARYLTAAEAYLLAGDSQNALRLCEVIYSPELLAKDSVAWGALDAGLNAVSESWGGYDYALIRQPKSLMLATDMALLAKNTTEMKPRYIAYPKGLKKGDRVYFASRDAGETSLQLYQVEFQGEEVWSRPVSVGPVVNTPLDEGLAILAADGKTLYFSSKGHYSMGGYDIFRTQYNSLTDQWSVPENLGFPFNSPFDDYLVGLPTEEGELVIASNRETSPDSVMLYALRYDFARPGRAFIEGESLHDLACWQMPPPQELAEHTTPSRIVQRQAVRTEQANPTFKEVESDPEYKKNLAIGYRYQRQSDSLAKPLEKLKKKMWDADTPEERQYYEQRVVDQEKAMLQAQRLADKYFSQAGAIEKEYITGHRTLLHGESGKAQFAQDDITHLYQCQLASTVFQVDEIQELARYAAQRDAWLKADKEFAQQEQYNAELFQDSTTPLGVLMQHEERTELLARDIVEQYGELVEVAHTLYIQCLPVAMIKSGRQDQEHVQAAEKKALKFYRMAQALGHLEEARTQGHSQAQAMLFTLLGNDYMEVGFTYAWGLEAYRQELIKRITFLEERLQVEQTDPAPKAEPAPPQKVVTPVEETPPLPAPTKPLVVGLKIVKPNPYDEAHPVEFDEELPAGVLYRWQLGAYSNPINPLLFNGLYPVHAQREGDATGNSKITRYYAGNFHTMAGARAGKKFVIEAGFPDAFLVAWYNGRSIALGRAEALEVHALTQEEQERVPRPSQPAGATGYAVSLGLYQEKLPESLVKTVQLLAPGKEFIIRNQEVGGTEYLVTSFATPDEAERLRNNLVASGVVKASVVSY